MGVAERRGREREEVRHKILDAARELFMAEGAGRVTMRRIALAIEYSPTAIYNHFEDKDALLNSLCEDEFGRLFALLRPAARPRSGVAWIRQLGLAYARFGLEYPNHYRFMFMTEAKVIEPAGGSPGQMSFAAIEQAVTAAISTGRFRAVDPHLCAQVLWSSIHGVVALLITYRPEQFPGVPARPDLVERVVENGIRGFLTRKPAAKGRRR